MNPSTLSLQKSPLPTGCPWRYIPTDFPPYRLVNYYYNKWTDNRTLEKVNTALRQQLREKSRNPGPTVTIIDSQSIKGTPESCLESGFDGGKLIQAHCRDKLRFHPLRFKKGNIAAGDWKLVATT